MSLPQILESLLSTRKMGHLVAGRVGAGTLISGSRHPRWLFLGFSKEGMADPSSKGGMADPSFGDSDIFEEASSSRAGTAQLNSWEQTFFFFRLCRSSPGGPWGCRLPSQDETQLARNPKHQLN